MKIIQKVLIAMIKVVHFNLFLLKLTLKNAKNFTEYQNFQKYLKSI